MNTRTTLILNSRPGSIEFHLDGTCTGQLINGARSMWWATWRDGVPLRGSMDGTDAEGTSYFPTRDDAFAALKAGDEGPLCPSKPVLPPPADPVMAYRTQLGDQLTDAAGIYTVIHLLGEACGERVARHVENLVLAEKRRT